MESFEKLEVWKTGIILVKEIYKATKKFPVDERFRLTNQLCRASTSILSNLAEGFSRSTSADKANKYVIARGECSEVRAQVLICKELELIDNETSNRLIALSNLTGKLLSGLINKYKT